MTLLTFPTVTDDTGTKTDGTIINSALFASIKTGIEAVTHSTNNATVDPNDIIDEVVTARGSAASLDARLDVALNADGSLANGVVQRFNTNTTPVGNIGAGEDNLIQYTLPANTLAATGRVVRITAWGSFAANGNNKTLKAYFGATSISLLSAVAVNSAAWIAVVHIIRTGASAEILFGELHYASTLAAITSPATPAEDTTAAVVIKFTGEATATNDVIQSGMIVEVMN